MNSVGRCRGNERCTRYHLRASRDFKIHYGGLLLRLLRPWGTRLPTPFPPQTSNRLRFRCTILYGNRVFSIRVSLQKWIRSTLFYFYTTKAWSMTTISFLLCWSHISQNLRPWQTRTHCCGHIVADTNVSPFARAEHLLRTQILCPAHKKCFWFCSETFCVRNKCFPVCVAQET